MKFFMKCDEAVHICDKSQYKEASFFEKLKFKMHILICSFCRGHAKRNSKLTETIKIANIKTLCPEEKQQLKIRIQEEMENGQQF